MDNSNHNKGGFFPVFADSKPTISNDRCTSIEGFNMLKYYVTKKYYQRCSFSWLELHAS